METRTETTASEASPQKPRSSTPRRRKDGRYRRTPSKRHTPTPRSSPYRCSKSRSKSKYKAPQRGVQSPLNLKTREHRNEELVSTKGEDENDAKDQDKDEAKDEQAPGGAKESTRPIVSEKVLADMEAVKRQYLRNRLPWAPLEERLFEILFLRQEIPLLPSYWEQYLLKFPMPEACYCWRGDMRPVVYAHANNTFRATAALERLIDLTADIRTACQSGLSTKAPQMIKKALEKFLNWAAEDGGYRHLEYLPNIIVEIVAKQREGMSETAFVKMRMGDLARSHRKKLAIEPEKHDGAVEEDVDMEVERQIQCEAEASTEERQKQATASGSQSWRMFGSRVMSRLFRLMGRRPIIKPEHHGETSVIESDAEETMAIEQGTPARDTVNVKQEDVDEDEGIRVPIKRELHSESEDDIAMADIPPAPSSAANSPSPPTLYRRQPPVIFGFFILGTNLMLVSADSSMDKPAMDPTLQFDLSFRNSSMCIWNALTVAIVVCLARDDMMERMGDFEEARVVEESDPDA